MIFPLIAWTIHQHDEGSVDLVCVRGGPEAHAARREPLRASQLAYSPDGASDGEDALGMPAAHRSDSRPARDRGGDLEGITMKVLFVAGFGPIVRDEASRHLYGDDLGIRLQAEDDGYLHTEGLDGVKTFALWPLSQAAESCFGAPEWPADVPIPQAWLEFDVEDIGSATAELRAKGYTLLVSAHTEPWGQTVTRLLAPEGILVGITYTPSMRGGEAPAHEERA